MAGSIKNKASNVVEVEVEAELGKNVIKIVATNVVASRPPNGYWLQRRPLVPIYEQVMKK